MSRNLNRNRETFNTMHQLESTAMSREQAEGVMLAIDNRVSDSIQEVLDKIDARFDVMENRFEVIENRFKIIDARFEALEKKLTWFYVQNITAISVIAAGFIGLIIAIISSS